MGFPIRNLILIYLLTLEACQEEQQLKDSVVESDTPTYTSPKGGDEAIADELATPSVPISGTNLIFEVPDDVIEDTVDAYVVGHLHTTTLSKLGPRSFILKNIPVGKRELIITGLRRNGEYYEENHEDYNAGVRFTREFFENEVLDEAMIMLPFTGSQGGRLEMIGVSSFNSITIQVAGTKIKPIQPQVDGKYTLENLPVGHHIISFTQKNDEQPVVVSSEVKESMGISFKENTQIYSAPNKPINVKISYYPKAVKLAWQSGGAGSEYYLVLRSQLPFTYSPEQGLNYHQGAILSKDLTVAYFGKDLSVVGYDLSYGEEYYYSIYAANIKGIYSKPARIDITTWPEINTSMSKKINLNSKTCTNNKLKTVVGSEDECINNIELTHDNNIDQTNSKSSLLSKGVESQFQDKLQAPINYKTVKTDGWIRHHYHSTNKTAVGYLLVRSISPVPFHPESGISYDIDTYGYYDVVAMGPAPVVNENILELDQAVYYYSLFSYDEFFHYSDPLMARAVIVD